MPQAGSYLTIHAFEKQHSAIIATNLINLADNKIALLVLHLLPGVGLAASISLRIALFESGETIIEKFTIFSNTGNFETETFVDIFV